MSFDVGRDVFRKARVKTKTTTTYADGSILLFYYYYNNYYYASLIQLAPTKWVTSLSIENLVAGTLAAV